MTEFTILDPGLHLPVGHHYDYDRLVAEAFRQRGIDTRIYGSKYPHVHLEGILSHFSCNIYSRIPEVDYGMFLAHHISELRQVLGPQTGDHIVFFPNASLLDLGALASDSSLSMAPSKIHLILRFFNHSELFLEGQNSSKIFLESARNLSNRPDKFLVYADTEALVEAWNQLGVNTSKIPIPVDPSIEFGSPEAHRKYQVGCLGQTNPSKGLYSVISALLNLAQSGLSPTAFIQTTFFEIPAEIRDRLPNVTFNSAPLSRSEYNRVLSEIRFYLNIYNADHYRYGSSGALLEAVIAGCIPLCTEYSFAREIFGEDLSLFSTPADEVSVYRRLTGFLTLSPAELHSLYCKLATVVLRLRQEHSPRRLAETLLAFHSN